MCLCLTSPSLCRDSVVDVFEVDVIVVVVVVVVVICVHRVFVKQSLLCNAHLTSVPIQ